MKILRLNAAFPYKTAASKVNVKTNSMGSTKWTYYKQWSFATNHLIFLKILFEQKNLFWIVNLMYQLPKYPCSYFLQAR